MFDCMLILESHDVDLSRAWCRLYQEAKVFMIILELCNHICRLWHVLDALYFPILLLIFCLFFRIIRFYLSHFPLTKESLWNFDFHRLVVIQTVGFITVGQCTFRNMHTDPIAVSHS